MDYRLSPSEARELIRLKLSHNFGVTPAEATHEHFYKAIVLIVRDLLQRGRSEFMQKAAVQDKKQVFYLCMEFLMGRSLKNNLSNLGLMDSMEKALSDFDIKLDKIFNQEPDAGLGNGGLGRLAAC
ncbi:MAG: glycogen/starch/alpha-glucan phosphorylase, partial [Clostridia bacterium]|nr:glycogen/starch/alpha-glucan phosphorylase [Clostridia bacterium]